MQEKQKMKLEFTKRSTDITVGAAIRRPRSKMFRFRQSSGEFVTLYRWATNGRPYNRYRELYFIRN